MGRRTRAIAASILAVVTAVGVVGCGEMTGRASTTTSVPQPTATATATVAITETDFTCPTTTNGSTKTFSDPQTGLSFSYPAAWTEQQCQRLSAPDGKSTLFIGNVFSVSVVPRNGENIQQLVAATKMANETVHLSALAVTHAVDAAAVADTVGENPQPDEPFALTMAIVEGSQRFYEVNWLTTQMSTNDTMPPNSSPDQRVQQVVTTFSVP